jgi:mRNA interferase YafQ
MLISHYAKRFKKSLSLAKKRNADIALLKEIMFALIDSNPLPPKFKDHALSGNYSGFRECHIKPDYLLIYKIDNSNIYFTAIGTHSDLFK